MLMLSQKIKREAEAKMTAWCSENGQRAHYEGRQGMYDDEFDHVEEVNWLYQPMRFTASEILASH